MIQKNVRAAARGMWEMIFPAQCIGCGAYTDSTGGVDAVDGDSADTSDISNTQKKYKYVCAECVRSITIAPSITCPACKRRVVFGDGGGFSSHAHCIHAQGYMRAA